MPNALSTKSIVMVTKLIFIVFAATLAFFVLVLATDDRSPDTSSVRGKEKRVVHRTCTSVKVKQCTNLWYKTVGLPLPFKHSQSEIETWFSRNPIIAHNLYLRNFSCLYYVPQCMGPSDVVYPCKSYCILMKDYAERLKATFPSEYDCGRLSDQVDNCWSYEKNSRGNKYSWVIHDKIKQTTSKSTIVNDAQSRRQQKLAEQRNRTRYRQTSSTHRNSVTKQYRSHSYNEYEVMRTPSTTAASNYRYKVKQSNIDRFVKSMKARLTSQEDSSGELEEQLKGLEEITKLNLQEKLERIEETVKKLMSWTIEGHRLVKEFSSQSSFLKN